MTVVSGDKTNGRDHGAAGAGRPLAVGVIAPARVARAMVAALELDDLVALVPARGRSYSFDALVIAVETPTSGEAAIREARNAHGSAARITVVAGAATPAEARKLLVDDVPGLVLESKAR